MPLDLSFFMQMLDTNPGFIWRTYADGRFRYWNRTWQEYSGFSLSAAGETNWLDALHPEDRDSFYERFLSGHQDMNAFSFELRVRNADGQFQTVIGKASPMRSVTGLFDGLSFLMLESDQRPRYVQILRPNDPATGLPDVQLFLTRMTTELEKSNRYNLPLSLIRVDINGITPINDIYGFDAGDAVLMELADVIKLNIRSYDMACRYENDDFLILFPNTRMEEAGLAMQHMVRAIMDMSVPWDNLILKISVSYGISKRLAGDTTDSFLQRVKDALTKAKNQTDKPVEPPVDVSMYVGEADRRVSDAAFS